ncbi:glycosyl hydrolase family 43 protein [Microthyrium microscopicum]|uniref:Glycosyl hydrolase family 43 protein n=1 Tax=Microthyrium microscopicum TaxID=703497 RepID=A0A6A6UFE9_9PEZI|nr:glycosyl hydrolase family 43 protein [Microthyrium microscopicum]
MKTAVALFLVGQALGNINANPIHSPGNPILGDGTYYSADPAPFVHNGSLYIVAGRDQAAPMQNDFVMNEWQIFKTDDPATNDWIHYPAIAKSNTLFKWAAPGRAYAAQLVPGKDGKFYLYAPVSQARSSSKDPFGVGVGVSNSPVGPFTDLHPAGPIVSQTSPPPGNDIQNIDPTVLIDDDGRVYMYYGTFGRLKGVELQKDMITPIGRSKDYGLPGFFEAAWLMKRKGTYYLVYAANNAGPTSPCTPTSYHACQAYATASSPLGPWTFRGVMLDVVTSTTSHAGAVEFKGQWYFAYHTAEAVGSTHFRRSVAIDKLEFDDTKTPPLIKKVRTTHRPKAQVSTRNVALKAKASSSRPVPIQYWVKALNDGRIPASPLPPDYWSSYDGDRSPATSTLTYEWSSPVSISGTRMAFFADQRAGSSIGVAPPAEWHLEYQSGGSWTRIAATYSNAVSDNPPEIKFPAVNAQAVRAVLTASGQGKHAGIGIKEWEVLAAGAA